MRQHKRIQFLYPSEKMDTAVDGLLSTGPTLSSLYKKVS